MAAGFLVVMGGLNVARPFEQGAAARSRPPARRPARCWRPTTSVNNSGVVATSLQPPPDAGPDQGAADQLAPVPRGAPPVGA